MRHKIFLVMLTVACIVVTAASGMCGQYGGGVMKAAASDACSGKSAGDSCTFTGMGGQSVTGTCKSFNSQTFCVPAGGFFKGRHAGMFANKPVVDANGTVYVTKMDSQKNTVVEAITPSSGTTVTYASNAHIYSLMLSGDASALVAVGGNGKGSSTSTTTSVTSTISVIPLPLTANPAVVNVSLTGRVVSAPTVKGNLIYVITATKANSVVSKTLTVIDLSGKTVYSGAI
ncbi:MAG: hypothetical protein HQL03_00120 [Nitrospirae bacterium]|nr:hypothetical protein [Nitrospirota bacterium]MBF0591169.1 hypothetical protein [Nitrospirota bacterium]